MATKLAEDHEQKVAATIWSDEKEYEFHPLSELFPLMEGAEFENLVEDVATNGQKETVKIHENKILDGRNRYRACRARKIPCRYEIWDGGSDPWDYVLSMNLHRRHLTAEVRQALVVELRQKGKSIRQIVETLQSSVGSVHRDIANATVPDGTVDAKELPTTIKGKDGKMRDATRSKSKAASTKPPKGKRAAKAVAKDGPAKSERPTVNELIQIIYGGLGKADEVEGLDPRKNVLYFRVNGHRVKVTCKIV